MRSCVRGVFRNATAGLSFMNFDAHIEFFGSVLHAQIRKVSTASMHLGVRPGMLVRYVHDWDCSGRSLDEVSERASEWVGE